MKIAICGSMVFSKKMLEIKRELENLKHQAIVSDFIKNYLLNDQKKIEKLVYKDKMENDAIMEYWDKIKNVDAVLVLNFTRKNIKNYIGGNSFLEMGFAYVLKKKIYLINPIPEMIYKDEIEAVKPIIINGDMSKIE